MTLDAAQPGSVTALIYYLEAAGFRPVSQSHGGMDGAQLIYEGVIDEVPAVVEIDADRGSWQALLKFEGMAKARIPDVWAAYLDGTEVGDHDIDYEAAFIRERASEAAAALLRDPDADRKMAEIGLAYVLRVQEKLRQEFED